MEPAPGRSLSDCPGKLQGAAQEHAVGEQDGGNFAVLVQDGAGNDQHRTGPGAGAQPLSDPPTRWMPPRRVRDFHQ
jgi:hypothetical protein